MVLNIPGYIELTLFCPGKAEHDTMALRHIKDIRNYAPIPDHLLTKVWTKDGSSIIVQESPGQIGDMISECIGKLNKKGE